MAIFVASTKSISRGKGQSAVASASYRAGEKLEDKRYGKTHDYSKRHGVMSADIILPTSLAEQNITIERSELWNLAEKTETRKNSRVAREWLVNLPHELDEKERKELAHNFTQSLADKFNVIADCAIHRPTEKEIERGADARNFHAHIMLTTRQAELDHDGKIKLAAKSVCELSDTDRKKLGLCKAKDEVTEIRQMWETLANEKLLAHGHNLIDSRSYESQGIDMLPQIKMGKTATHLERDGKTTLRGEINRAIAERNELVFNRELKQNNLINAKADQIIFESRREKKKEIEPVAPAAPQPKPKEKNIGSDAVAKALAMANQVKAKREQEKLQQAKERAEQVRRQIAERERKKEIERQKEIDRQRAEKAALERQEQEQAQEFINELRQMAGNAVNDTEQLITNIRLDKDKPAAKALIAVLAGKQIIDELDQYMKDDSKTDKQKELAEVKRHDMLERTIDNAKYALGEVKNLHYTSDRKQHLEPLQQALSSLDAPTQQQQKDLQAVERQVNDFSSSLDRSFSFNR